MTTASGALGTRWRAAARSMPTGAAAVFLALLLVSVLVMALAVTAGLVGELSERLATAGWAKARAIHNAYPPPAPASEATARGCPGHTGDPAAAHD